MALGEVIHTRMEAADRLPGAVASIASFVGREPSVHGVTDEGRHGTPRVLRPRTEGPCRVLGELNLHTCHVRKR